MLFRMAIQYPYLPEGKTISYVPADNPFMRAAKEAQKLSTVSNQPAGAVIVKNGTIIGRAANQSRLKSAQLRTLHERFCIRRLLHIPTGKHYWVCPGCANFHSHAESEVVRDARHKGHTTRNADVYLYGHWWCCQPCWDAMIAAGVKEVYLLEGSEKMFNAKR